MEKSEIVGPPPKSVFIVPCWVWVVTIPVLVVLMVGAFLYRYDALFVRWG